MSKKGLILDFGGVLLPVDYEAPVREFKKLGIDDFDRLFSKATQSFLFDEFEKGKITNEKFREEIRTISGKNISDVEIDAAWNSVLLDFPEEKMQFLNELKSKYRLFLLSNTNRIHVRFFIRAMDLKFGKDHFQSHFEKVYFSSSIGMRKPDPEIFLFVMEENHLKAEETVFIDDSIQHVLGARKTGIKGLHLDLQTEDLKGLLKRENLI